MLEVLFTTSISTVTWVYTNTHTRELNRYRPDRTGRHTLNPFYLLNTITYERDVTRN